MENFEEICGRLKAIEAGLKNITEMLSEYDFEPDDEELEEGEFEDSDDDDDEIGHGYDDDCEKQ